MNILPRLRLSMSFPRMLRGCLIGVLVFFIIESIIFNTVILWFILSLSSTLHAIFNAEGITFIDKLSTIKAFQDFVASGKEGSFKNLIEQTVGRLYIEQVESYTDTCDYYCGTIKNVSKRKVTSTIFQRPRLSISRVGFDVSESGEALYVMRRILRKKNLNPPWNRLIVDIGANDGLLSSNSYNFITWGWNAVLVEPQNSQLDLAKRNLNGLTSQHEAQRVDFVHGVIGEKDGTAKLLLSSDITAMESRVVPDNLNDGTFVTVPSYSVKTLAVKYDVPKYFGILSVDAEGMSSNILHQWIRLGFRPMYIIYEHLHERGSAMKVQSALASVGYKYLVRKGWNEIYELDNEHIGKHGN